MSRDNRHLSDGWLQKALSKVDNHRYPQVVVLTKPPVQRLRDLDQKTSDD